MKLLVCGGAGFIGSNFARLRIRDHGDEVRVLDKLTYAGREENLADLRDEPGFAFVRAGIEDPEAVEQAIAGVDAVVNFAAETHVDRSIAGPDAFITTHARRDVRPARGGPQGRRPATSRSPPTRSTARSRRGRSPRTRRSCRHSPYSASKAGADFLVAAYRHTYGLRRSSAAARTTTAPTSTPRSSSRS